MSNDTSNLVRIAHYYYNLGLTQQQIADKIGISRKTVNISLKRAIEEGVVQIRIQGYEGSDIEMEQKLVDTFGLSDALVIDEDGGSSVFSQMTLHYLDTFLTDGMNVGVNYGSTLAGIFTGVMPRIQKDINVVQLVGGANINDGTFKVEEVTKQFANIYGGNVYNLYIPNILDSELSKEIMMRETSFQPILQLYKKLDALVIAVGTIQKTDILLTQGYISEEEHKKIEEKDAVCDICFRFIDKHGQIVDPDLEARVTGISTEDFKNVPKRLCISYGEKKQLAILSAIKGGFIDYLITDHKTAQGILNLYKKEKE